MEHPERVKTNHKTWRERNKQQWARVVAIAGASYRKRHPERLRAIEVARKRAKSATPAWGDKAMMRTVYRKAREFGMEVDHIVPLKHPLVCGLHVWHNLQLLKRTENRSKNNRAWPDMPS